MWRLKHSKKCSSKAQNEKKEVNFKMIRPDFNGFLSHSAKGSVWKEHAYLKRVDGKYYYPNNYTKGRTIDSLKKAATGGYKPTLKKFKETPESKARLKVATNLTGDAKIVRMKKDETSKPENKIEVNNQNLSQEEINQLASRVIRGDFGNGQIRKDLLGENYQAIQNKVNELMKVIKVDQLTFTGVPPEIKEKGDNALKEATKKVEKVTVASKGINMDQVQSVYKKKKNRGD